MNLENLMTPWAYDELQLIGAELGDTVDFINEKNEIGRGVIVLLNKMIVYVLTENNQIVKFGRTSLVSLDDAQEIVGLSEKQIRVSAKDWQEARKNITASFKKDKKWKLTQKKKLIH